MEVKINKNNNQKYVTIPKESSLKEGDRINLVKIQPITKEQLEKKVKQNKRIQNLFKDFTKITNSIFNDIEWTFIEEMKKSLNIKTVESDDGYEKFEVNNFEIEYIWGEGFEDDFGETHIPFCNDCGIQSCTESYFKQILNDESMMNNMIENSKEIAIIKIYTDLVESYHKKKLQNLRISINEHLDLPDVNKNGVNDFYINFEDMEINFLYEREGYFTITQDGNKIYL